MLHQVGRYFISNSEASWSPSGNHLVSGHRDGIIAIHSYPIVSRVSQFSKPEEDVSEGKYCGENSSSTVNSIYWFEEKEFVATYKGQEDFYLYIMPFNSSYKVTKSWKYTLPAQMPEDESKGISNFFLDYISSWKLLVVSASNAGYIELLGKEGEDWKNFTLADEVRANIPLGPGFLL